MYDWATLPYSQNWHNIVNQLSFPFLPFLSLSFYNSSASCEEYIFFLPFPVGQPYSSDRFGFWQILKKNLHSSRQKLPALYFWSAWEKLRWGKIQGRFLWTESWTFILDISSWVCKHLARPVRAVDVLSPELHNWPTWSHQELLPTSSWPSPCLLFLLPLAVWPLTLSNILYSLMNTSLSW